MTRRSGAFITRCSGWTEHAGFWLIDEEMRYGYLWYAMRDGVATESITDVDWWYRTRVGPAHFRPEVDSDQKHDLVGASFINGHKYVVSD